MPLKKIKSIIRSRSIRTLNYIGMSILQRGVREKDFTIFSNDCYGAEIYRWLKVEYNTPFVGLMLMAPCYIKFLSNPEYYCSLPVEFIDSSMYSGMNTFRGKHPYPLGMIGDIEIHFLHYPSREEAKSKWERRVKRINWNKLKVKFAMDKDYSTPALLQQFEQLTYPGKICFSKENYPWADSNIALPGYALDATIVFRNSLRYFNLISWLNEGQKKFRNTAEKLTGKILYNTLRR